jgi:anti-anti-sigma regulatory factor
MTEESGKYNALRIEDDLTAVNAVRLREQLTGTLEGEGPVLLDLSEVEEMDTAGFQLLAALRQEADSMLY